MKYVEGIDRNTLMLCSLDSFVDENSIARVIDAFVEGLNLEQYGIKEQVTGRPAYDPKSLVKLYIYGSKEGIQSSRKLEQSCKVNLEIMWMISGITPSFKTIANFLSDNVDALKDIFSDFNRSIIKEESNYTSMSDTSKNSAEMKKTDDKARRMDARSDEYLRILKDMDEQDAMEELSIVHQIAFKQSGTTIRQTGETIQKYQDLLKKFDDSKSDETVEMDYDVNLKKEESASPSTEYTIVHAMKEKAREGYFIRDIKKNIVYCPNGEILRQKSVRKNGYIRYANKNACKHCKYLSQCYKGDGGWKEVDFAKDEVERHCNVVLGAKESAN